MPLPLLTRRAEGAAGDDGDQGTGLRTVAAGVAGGPRSAGPLLPAPGTVARLRLCPRSGSWGVRRHGTAQHRSGRLLQAPARAVLRGAAFGAPAAAGGGGPPEPALVPRVRPDRALARPFEPDPDPRAVRAGR